MTYRVIVNSAWFSAIKKIADNTPFNVYFSEPVKRGQKIALSDGNEMKIVIVAQDSIETGGGECAPVIIANG